MREIDLRKKQKKCKHDIMHPVFGSKVDIRCRKCQASLKRYFCKRCNKIHDLLRKEKSMSQKSIKFRAEYENKIYEVASIDFANKLGIQVGLKMLNAIIVIHIDNVHLLQFTGLHDKSGNEIYEGDIVLRNGISQEVIYEAPRFEPSCLDECEVIGNIYENPELLGKEPNV